MNNKKIFDELKKHIGEYVVIRYVNPYENIIEARIQLANVLDYVCVNDFCFIGEDSVILNIDLEDGTRIFDLNIPSEEIISKMHEISLDSYSKVFSHHSKKWIDENKNDYTDMELIEYSLYTNLSGYGPKMDIDPSWLNYYEGKEFDADVEESRKKLSENIGYYFYEISKERFSEINDICEEFHEEYGYNLLKWTYVYFKQFFGLSKEEVKRDDDESPYYRDRGENFTKSLKAFNYFIKKVKIDYPFETEERIKRK